MSLARTLGRLGALLVALVGGVVAYVGLVASSPIVASGLEALLAGVVTPAAVVGVVGVLVALVALAVVVGRGRAAAVSVGALLVVVGVVVLVLPLLSPLAALGLLAVGLTLFLSGASLNGVRRDDPA